MDFIALSLAAFCIKRENMTPSLPSHIFAFHNGKVLAGDYLIIKGGVIGY